MIRLNLQLFIYSIVSVKLVRSRCDLFWFHISILSGVIVASSLKARCTSQRSPCRNGRWPDTSKISWSGHTELLLNFLDMPDSHSPAFPKYLYLTKKKIDKINFYKAGCATQEILRNSENYCSWLGHRSWHICGCVSSSLWQNPAAPNDNQFNPPSFTGKPRPHRTQESKSITLWTGCLGDTFQNRNSNSKKFRASVRGRRRPDRVYFLSLTFASSANPRQLRLSRGPRLGNGI